MEFCLSAWTGLCLLLILLLLVQGLVSSSSSSLSQSSQVHLEVPLLAETLLKHPRKHEPGNHDGLDP